MNSIHEIKTRTYKLTVAVETPPALFRNEETHYLYLIKYYPNERVENQCIGIGMTEIDGLLQLLNRVSSEYQGKRKEFRIKS